MSVFQMLPQRIAAQCQKYCDLCEIRLRKDCEVAIETKTRRIILPEKISESELMDVVLKCCNHSIYTINEQLRQGFLTFEGMRIGVCGEAVYEKERLITIKNFSSLNIRIARQIDTYDEKLHDLLFSKGLKNVLIFSKVGVGKTTLARCIAKKLSYAKQLYNIIVVDERNEFSDFCRFDLGRCDVYSSISKQSGIEFAVKTMSPDLIVCDELKVFEDLFAVFEGGNCGVKFVATIHAESVKDLLKKEYFSFAFEKKLFDYFVQLSDKRGKGTVERVFDHEFNAVF